LNDVHKFILSGCFSCTIIIQYDRKSSEENPQATWSRVNKFMDAFKERWGAVTYRELTRLDVKTPEGMKEYLKSVHDYACTERVKFAVKKAIELLEKHPIFSYKQQELS
jgi:spore coat polysaccharide biosynthesis protein SpsF (cytidylyltransferase family)